MRAEYPKASWAPSPNYSRSRREPISLIVIHITDGQPRTDRCVTRFQQARTQASAHFVVREAVHAADRILGEGAIREHARGRLDESEDEGGRCEASPTPPAPGRFVSPWLQRDPYVVQVRTERQSARSRRGLRTDGAKAHPPVARAGGAPPAGSGRPPRGT